MDDIRKEIDELFNEIKDSDSYKNYLLCKMQMEKDNDIVRLINEIKEKQKEVTKKANKETENDLKKLYKTLESYPVYQSYKGYMDELNNMLFEVKNTFEKYFESILNI